MSKFRGLNQSGITGRLVKDPKVFNGGDASKRMSCLFTIAVPNGEDANGNDQAVFVPCVLFHEPRIQRFCELKSGDEVTVHGRMSSYLRVHSGLYDAQGKALKDIYENRVEILVDQWAPGRTAKKNLPGAQIAPPAAQPPQPNAAPKASDAGVAQMLALLSNPDGMQMLQKLAKTLTATADEAERRLTATASQTNVEDHAPGDPPWGPTVGV